MVGALPKGKQRQTAKQEGIEMETNMGIRQKRKRRNAAVTAVILAILLLLTGTFAWQSLSQSTMGEASGETGPAGARLHDDFELFSDDDASPNYKLWKNGMTGNKDIYVENYESADKGRDVFARVKMYEYMEVGPGAKEGPSALGYDAESLIVGADRGDVTTWETWHLGATSVFTTYWDYTNGGQKVYMPTFNKDREDDRSDIKGDAKDYQVPSNTTLYATDAGLHSYWTVGDPETFDEDYYDYDTGTHEQNPGVTHNAKNTETATVMTMAQWKAAGRNAGNYWVVDEDGWAYWANAIAPQTATGLLLSDIYLKIEPEDEWFYAIHTWMQAASAGDWGDPAEETGFYEVPDEDPSPDALYLLNQAAGYVPKVISMSFDEPVMFAYINASLTLSPDVITQYTDDPVDKKVTWEISPATGTFNNGVFTPSAGDVGKWFTVTATSVLTPTVSASIDVYVPISGDTIVLSDANGKLYKDMGQNCYSEIMPDGSVSPVVYCAGLNEQPGTPAEFGPVFDYDGTYYYQLGPNRYQGPGADAKLGTGDDDILYCATPEDFSTLAPVTDQYVVHVSPAAAEITKGESLTFSAVVWLENTSQDGSGLTWTLVGSHLSGTSLSTNSGVSVELTVATAEPAKSIILRATMPGDGDGIMGSYRDITILLGNPNPVADLNVWEEFTDDKGVEWVVISKGTGPDSGHKLILTKYVYDYGKSYNLTNEWTPLEFSNARGLLNAFYTNKVGSDVKKYAVKFSPNPLTDFRTAVGGFDRDENDPTGYSHPGIGSPASDGNDGLFLLSISEANEYYGTGATYNNLRIAYDAKSNTTSRRWTLRSPGSGNAWKVSHIAMAGNVGSNIITAKNYGYRYALWVKG